MFLHSLLLFANWLIYFTLFSLLWPFVGAHSVV